MTTTSKTVTITIIHIYIAYIDERGSDYNGTKRVNSKKQLGGKLKNTLRNTFWVTYSVCVCVCVCVCVRACVCVCERERENSKFANQCVYKS